MNKINFANNSEPALSAENLNQMQDNIENAIKENEKTTIYNGTLKGGENIILSDIKGFLDVYAVVIIGNKIGYIKYTINTKASGTSYSSGIIVSQDETSGLVYYISESSFDKTTNQFTHVRTGYFDILNASYTNKNNSSIYYIYQIDTYDK